MSDPVRPFDAEHEIDSGHAARLISSQFPALSTAPVTLLGRGWDNIAYLTSDDVVFRFPRKASAATLLETEAAVLPLLADRLPLTTPDPRWRGRPDDTFPWPFLGYRRLPGRPASAAGLRTAQRCALAPVLGRFLRALHDTPIPPGTPPDVLNRRDFATRLPLMLERVDTLRRHGVIGSPRPWLALFDELSSPSHEMTATLVHGDLYARHLLVDGAGALTGVIDWGDVHAGDIAMDLMLAWGFLPAAARAAFFTAYGAAGDDVLRTARLRAAFHAVSITWYGLEPGAEDLLEEGRAALRFVLED